MPSGFRPEPRLIMAETEGNSTSTTKYEYNGANELLKKIYPSGQTTEYQYDANGNRVSKIDNQTTDYSYDFENRLTKIDEHNGKSIEYAYNADGVRLSKTVNNPNSTKEVTKFVNDVANPLEQVLAIYDDKDNLQVSYVYGNERISVHDMDTTTGAEKDPLYYLYDGLGSVVQLTDSTGKTADQYAFDEFGNEVAGGKQSPNATNVLHNNFGYAGEQWDAEAGLQYLRNRYYDPEVGRFINRDSVLGDISNPISQNRYAYVWNNPVNLTDPSGNKPAGMSYEAYIANLKNQIAVQENYNPSRTSCSERSRNQDVGGSVEDRINKRSQEGSNDWALGDNRLQDNINDFIENAYWGDIILTNGGISPIVDGVVDAVTGGPYSHAAMYIGDGLIAQMGPDGFEIVSVGEFFNNYNDIDIYRMNSIKDNFSLRKQIVNWTEQQTRLKYDYLNLLFLSSPDPNKAICSELIWRAYRYVGINLGEHSTYYRNDGIEIKQFSPNDLAKSNKLNFVKHLDGLKGM